MLSLADGPGTRTGSSRIDMASTRRESTEPVSAEDQAASVRQQIRASILRGDYAPLQRLIEADLCDRFGVSRFVVRTALQELAAQGLVEFQRNRGARVRDVSIAEAIEITEVRQLLEGLVAARAATNITKSEAAELRQLAKDMRSATAAGELLGYHELNAVLHRRLREIASHEISSRLLEQLRDLTVRHQVTLSLVPGRSQVSLPQHEEIVAAVTRRDPARAEQAMHAHLQSVIDALTTLAAAQNAGI